jgi:hypothetical protein
MAESAYLLPKKTDFAFTRIVVSHVASSVKWRTAGKRASMLIPALLTRLETIRGSGLGKDK